MYRTIETINSPEFIDLKPTDLNPEISECKIKVLHLGLNRNGTAFSREMAEEMAKTLRGVPIVGHYIKGKGDFGDHDKKIVIEDDEIKFIKETTPYGFVSPDAKVWFEEFQEYDDKGNAVTREYLVTTGYLWTGQFPECQAIIDEGRPQSMEIRQKGYWTNDSNIEFFMITDAAFRALCILGDDILPACGDANISKYSVNDESFKTTLYSMRQDLKNSLQGGKQTVELENQIDENKIEDTPAAEGPQQKPEEENQVVENTAEQPTNPEENNVDDTPAEDTVPAADYSALKEQLDAQTAMCEKLNSQLSELQAKYSALEQERDELYSYKADIEDSKKDELIKSFHMLSEEDKQEIIDNKANYSFDEIKSKLSVIYVEKKVNFNEKEEEKSKEEDFTYSVKNDFVNDEVPAFIKALEKSRKNK